MGEWIEGEREAFVGISGAFVTTCALEGLTVMPPIPL